MGPAQHLVHGIRLSKQVEVQICRVESRGQELGLGGMEDGGHHRGSSPMPHTGEVLSSGDRTHKSCLEGVPRQMQKTRREQQTELCLISAAAEICSLSGRESE